MTMAGIFQPVRTSLRYVAFVIGVSSKKKTIVGLIRLIAVLFRPEVKRSGQGVIVVMTSQVGGRAVV